jgi:endo-1,4-beta-xylanase
MLVFNRIGRGISRPRAFQAHLVAVFAALTLGFVYPAAAQTVLQTDFEDGSTQGWVPRGPVTLTNSTDTASSGTHSLLTTGRTATWNGPSYNLLGLLTMGATYQVTASVRLATGAAATTIRMTVQRTPTGGSTLYDTVAQNSSVTDSAWVTLTGLYAYPTDVSDLTLYVEAPNDATVSYYIDNVTITKIADPPGPPPNTNGLTSTFESGTTEGWTPRIGGEILTPTTADAHSGSYSLLTTNRGAAYYGPKYDVTNIMFNGSRYRVAVWAKLAPGEPDTSLRVSLERHAGSITTYHTVVGNTVVTSSQWVPLAVTYDVALANSALYLYVESASGTASFYIDDVSVTYMPPPVVDESLPSVYQQMARYFPVGAAIYSADISGVHAELLKKHFNSITAENDMKWDAIEPTEGNFNFGPADALVNFAKANNMFVRGHTLVWHQQVPAWVFQVNGAPMTPTPENKALLLQREENHIRGVVGHYVNDVSSWDVVNEAVDPNQPDCLLHSTWYQITGTDYIDRAFQVAREVAPNAKLYYNDYNTNDPARRACIIQLVKGLKQRGIPIDGVGHQMHSNIDYPTAASIGESIAAFALMGLDNQITEMDNSVYSDNTTVYTEVPPEILAKQGYRYRDYFNVFKLLHPWISNVTLWGLADDHTWLSTFPITRLNLPLLFGQSFEAKPAYWGVVDPRQLPGAGLAASIASKTGPQNARVWTINMYNPSPGPAYSTEITGFTLTQIWPFWNTCKPKVTSPAAFPLAVGDVPSASTMSVPITIDFTGCSNSALFAVTAPFDSIAGVNKGLLLRLTEFR